LNSTALINLPSITTGSVSMTEIFNIPDSYFAIIMVCWSPLHAHARPIDEIQKFDDKKLFR